MPLEMLKADEHHLKPAHGELPLVFMTVLTQMSLGAFTALFIGDILSLFGFFEPNWILALLVLVPAALGLPLSALHLGRPLKALSAMKNLKTSWLSREAAALGAFAGLMSVNVALYFFDIATTIRLLFELLTLIVGIYGIHAQAMIYRIPARPSWDRFSTNQKFFTTAYSGLFLVALALMILGFSHSATVLLSSAMIVAVIHGFFTLDAYNELKNSTAPQLEKTLRLYRERFNTLHTARWITLGLGALALPLLATLFIASGLTTDAIVTLCLSFVLVLTSELFDRFLFYTTTVPLQMAGGFFVGAQRK
jgi:DMSO reductase anchor subunit